MKFTPKQQAYIDKFVEFQNEIFSKKPEIKDGISCYPLTEEFEDRMYDELDVLWWDMSKEEQEELDTNPEAFPNPIKRNI